MFVLSQLQVGKKLAGVVGDEAVCPTYVILKQVAAKILAEEIFNNQSPVVLKDVYWS